MNNVPLNLTYYLSGPMSNIVEYNYPYFQAITIRLRAMGFTIKSPHENPEAPPEYSPEQIWQFQMKQCMEVMEECDAIILMRGWSRSSGARIELNFALDRKWPVFFYLDPPGRPINMTELKPLGY